MQLTEVYEEHHVSEVNGLLFQKAKESAQGKNNCPFFKFLVVGLQLILNHLAYKNRKP